ncbi:efflux RND transporter periplasmic adaptor subunit [Colwellia sp. D2M02]|uniref:efflux RND transporter periplasmic adaptor subunit n=1 Tax=Colwellia sp. D2M02 TaxID=2841562 RepID=UPI001C096B16|nr:efflux RND transporter periplasmic adaptor subunit [Colwellia sp. D2M02]MBU2894665.1 efflux RND transporter periplasmic adaptor subunit [Colwellia sp. D2M02]
MKLFNVISLLVAVISPVFLSESYAGTPQREQQLSFTNKQMQLANIQVATIKSRYMDQRLYAPGEIQANGYTSYVVSPRVESVIVRRHAILGEHVEQGQALVTLFSETVAEAQALYRIAYADWQRAKKVGNGVISESELLNAKTDYIAAYSRLKAYGLTDRAIDIVANDHSSALGEYTLKAERSGAVLSDNFQQGQRVSAGERIMVLTNESELWIEARLAANNPAILSKGTKAEVVLTRSNNDSVNYQAEVIQQSHTIDPKTRTRIVRLQVNNDDHQLHPGLFVDVYFALTTEKPVLVVPETALLRGADGDWQVYVQQSEQHDEQSEVAHQHNEVEQHDEQSEVAHQHNEAEQPITEQHEESVAFIAQEVELGALYRTYSQENKQWYSWREIYGVSENSNIAVTGAFFIASQGAKSGFDTHNH